MIRPAAVGLAAVIGGAVGAASMTAATAVTVPLDADFGIVLPGETAQASTDLAVPARSIVTKAEWVEVSGSGVWGAALCSASECTPLEELAGTAVDAGRYRVVIDVTMPMDASATSRTAASGEIALMESVELPLTDGRLAATGGTMPWIAALAGAAALAGGTAILIRRRKHEEEDAR